MIDVSLVVPFFNEKKTIVNTYKKITTFLRNNYPHYELIMIDDGSFDGSYHIIKPYVKKDKRLRLIRSLPNQGRGFVLTKAFQKARGKLVGHIDADLEIDIEYLAKAIKVIENEKADLVIASKNHPESRVLSTDFRKVASRIYGLIMFIILRLRLHSYQSGLKLLRRQCMKKLIPKVTSPGWFWDTEILYWASQLGFKIYELPVTISYGRDSRTSPIKDAVRVIKEALRLKWRILTNKS